MEVCAIVDQVQIMIQISIKFLFTSVLLTHIFPASVGLWNPLHCLLLYHVEIFSQWDTLWLSSDWAGDPGSRALTECWNTPIQPSDMISSTGLES